MNGQPQFIAFHVGKNKLIYFFAELLHGKELMGEQLRWETDGQAGKNNLKLSASMDDKMSAG